MKRLSERRIKQLLANDGHALEGADFTAYEFELALRELQELRRTRTRCPAKAPAKAPLAVEVADEQLVIRVGIDCLACATANGDSFHEFDDAKNQYVRPFAIIDNRQFAKDVVMAMQHEEENGSGPLGDFFDSMARAAIDDGSTGIDHDQRVVFGKKGKGEKY